MTDDETELARVDRTLASMARLVRGPLSLSDEHAADVSDFAPSRRQDALQRVDIYREQFWLRHLESLREDFPGTSALLTSTWVELCTQYLAAHPPCTPSLRELGFQLPDYLASLGAAVVPEVAVDMARLELAYLEVFDALDETPLDVTRLQAFGPNEWTLVRFELSNALRLLDLRFSVADLRRTLRGGGTFPPLPIQAPIRLAVYRRERALFDHELCREAFELLVHLGRGLPLSAACDRTAQSHPGAAAVLDAHLSEWFATWARLGWLARVLGPAS
jgi:hypothetical protein